MPTDATPREEFTPADPSGPPPTGHLTRRRVLRVGGGGALALVIGATAGWADRRGDDPAAGPTSPTSTASTTSTTTTTAPVVIPDIGQVDPAIVRLGERVIETTGGGDDVESLLRQLPAADGDPLEQAAAVTRREFEHGDTVDVDGWILAVSEARAAAAVALLCRNRDGGC